MQIFPYGPETRRVLTQRFKVAACPGYGRELVLSDWMNRDEEVV